MFRATIRKPPIIEEPFAARLGPYGSGHPLLSGLSTDTAPPLLGYDVAFAKPTAETLLLTHRDDPLLAVWQYGLGKSVAWTSDAAPRWSAQWLGWQGFPAFWAQTVRWSLKSPENSGENGFLTARVVRDLMPKAHFATVYAKPMGRPLVDSFITEVSQDTWIFFPWDTGLSFQPPIRDGAA